MMCMNFVIDCLSNIYTVKFKVIQLSRGGSTKICRIYWQSVYRHRIWLKHSRRRVNKNSLGVVIRR